MKTRTDIRIYAKNKQLLRYILFADVAIVRNEN